MIIHTMVKMTIIIAMTIMIPAIFVELGTVMILCSTSTRIKFVMTHMDKMATRILIILKLIIKAERNARRFVSTSKNAMATSTPPSMKGVRYGMDHPFMPIPGMDTKQERTAT